MKNINKAGFRFAFEVQLESVDQIRTAQEVVVTWERGPKIVTSSPHRVDKSSKAVNFGSEALRQDVTMFKKKKDNADYEPKVYRISVRSGSGSGKVLGRIDLNFADYTGVPSFNKRLAAPLSSGSKLIMRVNSRYMGEAETKRKNRSGGSRSARDDDTSSVTSDSTVGADSYSPTAAEEMAERDRDEQDLDDLALDAGLDDDGSGYGPSPSSKSSTYARSNGYSSANSSRNTGASTLPTGGYTSRAPMSSATAATSARDDGYGSTSRPGQSLDSGSSRRGGYNIDAESSRTSQHRIDSSTSSSSLASGSASQSNGSSGRLAPSRSLRNMMRKDKSGKGADGVAESASSRGLGRLRRKQSANENPSTSSGGGAAGTSRAPVRLEKQPLQAYNPASSRPAEYANGGWSNGGADVGQTYGHGEGMGGVGEIERLRAENKSLRRANDQLKEQINEAEAYGGFGNGGMNQTAVQELEQENSALKRDVEDLKTRLDREPVYADVVRDLREAKIALALLTQECDELRQQARMGGGSSSIAARNML